MAANRCDAALRQLTSTRRPLLAAGMAMLLNLGNLRPSDAKKHKHRKKKSRCPGRTLLTASAFCAATPDVSCNASGLRCTCATTLDGVQACFASHTLKGVTSCKLCGCYETCLTLPVTGLACGIPCETPL